MTDSTPSTDPVKSTSDDSPSTGSASQSNDMPAEITQDSKNLAVLNWVGTIFLGFLPGLILYLVQKEDAYVQDQSKEALNWSITLLFGYCIAFFLSFIVIGLFLFPVLGVVHLIFCILGIVGTQKGETFRVPYAIRLIK